jgi:oligopeptide transport system ATP-binding protein
MAVLIESRHIVKRHSRSGIASAGARVGPAAVDDVTFSIDGGSVFGLVGESGCGKSTLARALLFLDPPTSGQVLYDGQLLGGLHRAGLRDLRQRMQIVFQDPNGALDPRMRVVESMQEGLANLRVPAAQRKARIEELLDLVGISPALASRYPHEFSGGQKQRIVIARALSVDPQFLVLDEPVSNLDVSIQAQIINLLLDLKKQFSLTYLFISHDLHLVSYLSDRVGVMFRGRLVEIASTTELLARPLHPYTVRLFSSVLEVGEAAAIPDASPREEVLEESKRVLGCPYEGLCEKANEQCRQKAPLLKDIGGEHFVACWRVEEARAHET